MRTFDFFGCGFCFLAFLLLFSSATFGFNHHRGEDTMLGGIRESQGSQNSAEIEELARFAVDEHNKKQVHFFYFFYLNISIIFFLCVIFIFLLCWFLFNSTDFL